MRAAKKPLLSLIITCSLLLYGCETQPVTPSSGDADMPASDVVWSTRAGSSRDMHVLNWACTVVNTGTVTSDSLEIMCLDADGDIRAGYDRELRLDPGKSMNVGGEFDVPSVEIPKIKRVVATLVSDSRE